MQEELAEVSGARNSSRPSIRIRYYDHHFLLFGKACVGSYPPPPPPPAYGLYARVNDENDGRPLSTTVMRHPKHCTHITTFRGLLLRTTTGRVSRGPSIGCQAIAAKSSFIARHMPLWCSQARYPRTDFLKRASLVDALCRGAGGGPH